MKAIVATLLLSLLVSSCAAESATGVRRSEPPSPGPAPWQGPLADRMNQQALRPATPALRSLVGEAPLVYLARVPARGATDEPAYEVAVFDDGTLVYEGHRCVEVGGVAITRVASDDLAQLRELLAVRCSDLGGTLNDDELCAAAATVHVACSDGQRIQRASDHCRRRDETEGRRIDDLVTAVAARLGLDSWLGEPTRRQACTPGARDLAPHELARTIRSDLADARH